MADKSPSASSPARGPDFGFKVWDRGVATITSIGLIIGGGWGLYTYFQKRDQDIETRNQEYKLARYKERKELYYPMCKAVGEIASSKTARDAEPAIKNFLTLYYGGVHMVSDKTVNEAKKDFYQALDEFRTGPSDQPPPPTLITKANALVKACGESLDLEGVFGVVKQEDNGSSNSNNRPAN
jgi:hypothetical protein